MPVIAEMVLRSDREFTPTTRQLHGLACALFEGAMSDGHNAQDKPFSVWPLVPADGGWLLRAAWLAPGVPQTLLAGCGTLRLGSCFYPVTDLALRTETHQDMASGPGATWADAEFCSPTWFARVDGGTSVVPDPVLIVGSWRRHWNATVTGDRLLVSNDHFEEIAGAVRLTQFDLHTESRDRGQPGGTIAGEGAARPPSGGTRTGFTGTARLSLRRGCPEEIGCAFGALARFAEFSGTGAQTTHGFGATAITLSRQRPTPGQRQDQRVTHGRAAS